MTSNTQELHPAPQRANRFLIIGALAGFILAASSLMEINSDLNTDAAATVNDSVISKENYLTYLSLLANDKRNPLTDGDRRHILNRMIEEKLLVERGINMGLADTDPNVRKTITSAVIATVTTEASAAEPSESDLKNFYEKNLGYFAQPARIQLQRMIFRGDNADQRAQQAYQSLTEGQDYLTVKQQLASRDILQLPSSPLPPSKLRQYIGPQLTDAALTLAPGEFSQPIAEGKGYSLLFVINNEQAAPKPFDSVRDLVETEFTRRAGDELLKNYLEQLRRSADVSIDEAFLDSLNDL